MKKIKEYIKNNVMVSICIFIITIIVLGIIGYSIFKNNSNEDMLIDKMENLGKNFYEDNYYISLSTDTRSDFLFNFKDIGIKIDLENLIKNEKGLENYFFNSLTEEKCDTKESKVVIYPKSPFGVDDYELVVNLECGFDN